MDTYFDIPDFNNYQITKDGIVRNKSTCKILKQRMKDGYMYVVLCTNCERKYSLIHRLLAITFIPNIDNKLFIIYYQSF